MMPPYSQLCLWQLLAAGQDGPRLCAPFTHQPLGSHLAWVSAINWAALMLTGTTTAHHEGAGAWDACVPLPAQRAALPAGPLLARGWAVHRLCWHRAQHRLLLHHAFELPSCC